MKISLDDDKFLRQYSSTPFIPSAKESRDETTEEIFNLQVYGLAKRLRHIGIKDVVIGVSGGLDSTLALLTSFKAFQMLGYDLKGIHAISMPGFGTSRKTKSNAKRLSESLGIDFRQISINDSVKQHFKDINHDEAVQDVTYENAQARERTQILMDLANKFNSIVIGTGDLSEIALGWNTFNGDHISMYNVNCGVPKTLVRYIIEWVAEAEFCEIIGGILIDICNTPISPELIPAKGTEEISQKTEETIGPYLVHDFFLYHFLRFGYDSEKLLFIAEVAFGSMFEDEELRKYLKVFITRFFKNQFKRNVSPDGPKIGTVSLSPRGDLRMPADAEYSAYLNNL